MLKQLVATFQATACLAPRAEPRAVRPVGNFRTYRGGGVDGMLRGSGR
jgi:hypothetical protein